MANIGYGFTKEEVLHVATNYVISVGKKSGSDSYFGYSWFCKFMKRCGDLQVTKPRKLAIIRAKTSSIKNSNKVLLWTEYNNVLKRSS